jgi:hypothetical protein
MNEHTFNPDSEPSSVCSSYPLIRPLAFENDTAHIMRPLALRMTQHI